MKNKNKGFTIVELVIVIAVVAVLAAVLIPTFSAIIKKANISADTQAARNMNIILTAESAASPAPDDPAAVIAFLKENGITDFSPQTRFYTFFWIGGDNVIILADEGDRPVYPEEYADEEFASNWYALDEAEALPTPTRPESSEGAQEPRLFTVSVTQSGSSMIIPFEGIPTQAKEGDEFKAEIILPEIYQIPESRYAIRKVTAIMHDGETEHKFVVRSEKGENYHFQYYEKAVLEIPCVTGNIEINIDVVEYCIITVTVPSYHIPSFPVHLRKGDSGGLRLTSLIESGREILSAKAYRNNEFLGELYDEKSGLIRVGKELTTDDFEIVVELAPIEPTPEPTE